MWLAYVGISKDLRSRIDQHLYRRDSSVTTAVSATVLNPDKIRRVCWWLDPAFADVAKREAAELIAFDLLGPVLRSRGGISERAKSFARDGAFRSRMELLFRGKPSGEYTPATLDNLREVVRELIERLERLERAVARASKE